MNRPQKNQCWDFFFLPGIPVPFSWNGALSLYVFLSTFRSMPGSSRAMRPAVRNTLSHLSSTESLRLLFFPWEMCCHHCLTSTFSHPSRFKCHLLQEALPYSHGFWTLPSFCSHDSLPAPLIQHLSIFPLQQGSLNTHLISTQLYFSSFGGGAVSFASDI